MARKLRVGFVGAGGIAQGAHFPGWERLPDVEIYAICDISKRTAKAAAEKAGVPPERTFTDYRKMLKLGELDIVDVCTPNAFHKGPTVAAFKAGKHVIVEKPIAVSATEARQMTAAGKAAGKLFMVAQSTRFTKEAQAIRHWVDEGLIGDIYWAHCTLLRRRGVPSWGVFAEKDKSGGGPVYDLGVHVLDAALFLMDFPQPVRVSASTYAEFGPRKTIMKHDHRKYDVEDFACALIKFANGATISLETSWALNVPQETFNVTVCGKKGGAQMQPLTLVQEEHGNFFTSQPHYLPDVASHSEEIVAFVKAIRSGGPSPVPGEQATITQTILDAMYKSSETGKEVAVKA